MIVTVMSEPRVLTCLSSWLDVEESVVETQGSARVMYHESVVAGRVIRRKGNGYSRSVAQMDIFRCSISPGLPCVVTLERDVEEGEVEFGHRLTRLGCAEIPDFREA